VRWRWRRVVNTDKNNGRPCVNANRISVRVVTLLRPSMTVRGTLVVGGHLLLGGKGLSQLHNTTICRHDTHTHTHTHTHTSQRLNVDTHTAVVVWGGPLEIPAVFLSGMVGLGILAVAVQSTGTHCESPTVLRATGGATVVSGWLTEYNHICILLCYSVTREAIKR